MRTVRENRPHSLLKPWSAGYKQTEKNMKMNDEHGCSLCTTAGTERYDSFFLGIGRKRRKLVQYDYRSENGELFSTVAPTLEECRRRRDEWLKKHN